MFSGLPTSILDKVCDGIKHTWKLSWLMCSHLRYNFYTEIANINIDGRHPCPLKIPKAKFVRDVSAMERRTLFSVDTCDMFETWEPTELQCSQIGCFANLLAVRDIHNITCCPYLGALKGTYNNGNKKKMPSGKLL